MVAGAFYKVWYPLVARATRPKDAASVAETLANVKTKVSSAAGEAAVAFTKPGWKRVLARTALDQVPFVVYSISGLVLAIATAGVAIEELADYFKKCGIPLLF